MQKAEIPLPPLLGADMTAQVKGLQCSSANPLRGLGIHNGRHEGVTDLGRLIGLDHQQVTTQRAVAVKARTAECHPS